MGLLVVWQGAELVAWARRQRATLLDDDNRAEGALVAGPVTVRRNTAPLEAGIGFVVGVLGGAVGLILGSLRLPALIRLLHVDPRTAAGTNLFIGFTMGSVGWIGHVARGNVDYPLVVLMGATAMVGSYIGARLTGRVTLNRLTATMGIVMIVVGAILVGQAATL